MTFRLVLDDHLLPVQMYFNAIPEYRFLDIVEALSHRHGRGLDICIIEFPELVEPGEEPFSGVKFYLPDEEVIISNQEFVMYVKKACEAHLREHPEDKDRTDTMLNRIRLNFPTQ
jgi:hypothetical protein